MVRKFIYRIKYYLEGKSAPYKGICGYCGGEVYHHYPWFTRNKQRHEDAQPLHESCSKQYLFGE